jgi:hypothetical protein
VRFGGWPLPTGGDAKALSVTLPGSLAGHIPTAWGAAPGQARVPASQVPRGAWGYIASRQGAHREAGEAETCARRPCGQHWVNGLRDAPRVCVGLHMPRHTRRVLPLLNAEPP